jgi:hypothetical protein
MVKPAPGSNSVKLQGEVPGTATFVYGASDGCLVIELYDHSPHAEQSFGNDVALLILVAAEHKPRMLALLREPDSAQPEYTDSELFEHLRGRFGDYFEVKQWLDANGIPYRKEFDGWA